MNNDFFGKMPEPLIDLLLWTRYGFSCMPWVYINYARIVYKKWRIPRPVEDTSDLVIEGFSRSGNTFAVAAFVLSQNSTINIASHLHSPAHVFVGCKLKKPTIVLIRNPKDVIVSNMIASSFIKCPNTILKTWCSFYKRILSIQEKVIVVDFDKLINDFQGVVIATNDFFKTEFDPSKIVDIEKSIIDEKVAELNQSNFSGVVNYTTVSIPHPKREKLKNKIRTIFERKVDFGLYNNAEELYSLYLKNVCV